jgi:hypothetical protein
MQQCAPSSCATVLTAAEQNGHEAVDLSARLHEYVQSHHNGLECHEWMMV